MLNWEPAPGEVQPTSCFRVEIRFVVDALGVPEPGTVSLTSMNSEGIGGDIGSSTPSRRTRC